MTDLSYQFLYAIRVLSDIKLMPVENQLEVIIFIYINFFSFFIVNKCVLSFSNYIKFSAFL